MPEQKDAVQFLSKEHVMFVGRSESAKNFSFLSSGSIRIAPLGLPVDNTKFLGTAIKNKSGLEFRGFLEKNAASSQERKFLLGTFLGQSDIVGTKVKHFNIF